MAFYLNSSYPQEQIVALEERCKNEGRTVPAMGMLFEIGSVDLIAWLEGMKNRADAERLMGLLISLKRDDEVSR